MPYTKTLASAAFALSLLAIPLTAQAAQDDDSLFILDGTKSSSHISYPDYRKVRVCVDKESVSRPLRIQHGLGGNVVEPGNCYTFQSTEFRVSTRGLMSDQEIIGRVQTVEE